MLLRASVLTLAMIMTLATTDLASARGAASTSSAGAASRTTVTIPSAHPNWICNCRFDNHPAGNWLTLQHEPVHAK